MEASELVFMPLGGVGEIGMNMALYGVGPKDDRRWLIVDFGVAFAHEAHPGADLIFADIRFLEHEKDRIEGIVITHGHEDHFGALFSLWPKLRAPVYATGFLADLVAAKGEAEYDAEDVPVTRVAQGEAVQIGPFNVEFVPVSHSIPEANALAIRTKHGLVLHTGDWKLDETPGVGRGTDIARLKELGQEGVLALVGDSTNATTEGSSISERDVEEELKRLIAKAPHRVAVTTFASNVSRVQAIARAARANDRQCVVVGRALLRFIEVAQEQGYLTDVPEFLSDDEYGYLPRDKVVAILTGSQGEKRAALARVASGEHRSVQFSKGDQVIMSSKTIPGNERAIGEVINNLARQDVDVITVKDAPVHVSGHPKRGDMRKLYEWIQPEMAIPVHGEEMHLKAHGKLARELGVREVLHVRNGWMARLAGGKVRSWDTNRGGRLYKDGSLVGTFEDMGIQERRKLSFVGHITVSITVNRQGEVLGQPQMCLAGIPERDAKGRLFISIVESGIFGALKGMPAKKRKDVDLLREAVRRSVRGEVHQYWSKKPVVAVMINLV
ncbi:ribonuclease J [Cohaesibacter celericrescens]|uniref:MBL fold metallo-hydrolase n=1 Tax=Cohaesibacter celericrescens TaxID=2067669 RepID=A0A2N5XSP2_9HYPH|nr:ribonuclease J [Cohaesibacter celericrescens]PLW77480.1 MBL fold metallo-hydrolase [Cohaesibacter celericrescens]